MSKHASISVAIVGAGIIGLSCARELASRGASVTVYESQTPGRGASWAAAGMLAPAFEAVPGKDTHTGLFDLCMASARLWPTFANSLVCTTGKSIGYSSGPSLAVATNAAEAKALTKLEQRLKDRKIPYNSLQPERANKIDSALSDKLTGILQLQTDGHVNNQRVIAALIQNCEKFPTIRIKASTCIRAPDRLLTGHDAVLCTTGWNASTLLEISDLVQPVGGQLLSVEKRAGAPSHTIRNGHIYIVPKANCVVIGASNEPGRIRTDTDPDMIRDLKRSAAKLCPVLEDSQIIDTWAGVRPATQDHGPLLGQIADKPIYVATGHYRNGILLAPVTAKIMADMIIDDYADELTGSFHPSRFACV